MKKPKYKNGYALSQTQNGNFVFSFTRDAETPTQSILVAEPKPTESEALESLKELMRLVL